MRAIIIKNRIEVDNRLEQLGLSRSQLIEAIEAMVLARAECTGNDPPAAPGWSAWRMGVRRLREAVLIEEDWEKDDTDQISSILNRKLGVRVTVANTDELTGIDDAHQFPQNRSRKGAATDRVVQTNQGSFVDILDESLKITHMSAITKQPGSIVTFYLCVFEGFDEWMAELSCPINVDGGFFAGFIERIFITDPTDGGGTPVRRRPYEGDTGTSDFDIPVKRK